jgi:hypothetical protein
MSARARLGGASPLANKIPSLRHEVGPCAGPCTATRARTGFQRVCTGPGCFRHHMVSFRHRSRSVFTSRPLGGAISGLRSPSPLGGDERPSVFLCSALLETAMLLSQRVRLRRNAPHSCDCVLCVLHARSAGDSGSCSNRCGMNYCECEYTCINVL